MKDREYWIGVCNKYVEAQKSIYMFCKEERICIHKFKYYRELLNLEGFEFEAYGHTASKVESKTKYWKKIFDDFVISNLSIKHYCKINGISRDSFRYWKDKLLITENYSFESPYEAIHDPIRKQNTNFIEFNLKDIETNKVSKTFKVDFNNISLTIDSTQNKNFIKKLIQELERFL